MSKSKKQQAAKALPVNVVFAETYVGCQTVANMMGLNVETVRKRAKAGKMPSKQDKNGTWLFTHNELVDAGIEPFASFGKGNGRTTIPSPRIVPPAKKNVTDVFFVLDRSGSMSGLADQTRRNLQTQIDALIKASGPNDEYYATIINFNGGVKVTTQRTNVLNLPAASSLYEWPSGSTNLFGAVHEAIELAHCADDGIKAFLISILTDGEDTDKARAVPTELIKKLTATDRYTFVYAGPRGSGLQAVNMGILPGNTTTWEQTGEGLQNLGHSTVQSLSTYTATRSTGVTSVNSFYAQPVVMDPSAFAGKLDNSLDDVTKAVRVVRVDNRDPAVINKFCEKKFGSFEKGKYFYELTESEKVQDYKKVVIQDKTTGTFYSGWDAAKRLLNIPNFQGTVRIKPGNLGDFKVFIQSTSTNRKLVPGTAVVYLP